MSRKLILKKCFLFIVLWPHILAFCISERRKLIMADVERRRIYRPYNYKDNICAFVAEALWRDKEFRNQFYLRIGGITAFVLNIILPSLNDMDLENCQNIGGGFCLIHGHGTIINKHCIIGRNCTVFHSVTIGSTERYPPQIGDNVFIGCGAKVLGNIKIGNNVKIGAGAVIVKDVPDNVTVVGVPAKIIKNVKT